MKIITFASPSHFALLRQFLNCYERMPEGVESIEIFQPTQVWPIPIYGSVPYWHHSRAQAVLTANAMERCAEGELLLATDCDVQWFQPLSRIAQIQPDKTMMFQMERDGRMCGGFMRFRVCDQSIRFCRRTVCEMASPDCGHATDVMNRLLQNDTWDWAGFEVNIVWSQGYVWQSGSPLPIPPPGMVVHHASWVTSLESKLALLSGIRNLVS